MLELKYDVFLKVSETGNFSRAAEEMSLTASAVSHIIAKLEREFGFSLFIRSRSGVVLTESGKRILAHLRSISAQHRLLEKEAAQIRDCAVGRVRIGTYYSVTVNWLAPLLPELRERYPNIEVSIDQGSYTMVMDWLENYTTDISIHIALKSPNTDFCPLYSEPIVCVAAPDFVPIHETYVTAEDLTANPLIGQRDGVDLDVAHYLRANHLNVKLFHRVEDDQSAMALASAGCGIALMPELCTRRRIADVRVFPLLPAAYRTIGIGVKDKKALDPASRVIYDEIVQFVRTQVGK